MRRRPWETLSRWVDKLSGKQIIHFLHIGKTGGTAIKLALRPYASSDRYRFELHPHAFTLRDVPVGEKVFFFVRDPISRFASGFYSRKRKGRPRYYSPWNPQEEEAFGRYNTPNDLGRALASQNGEIKSAAVKAMQSIKHVKSCYWDWFESEDYFLTRLDDVLFIGFQESLNDDFEALKELLSLPKSIKLPESGVEAHKSPADLDRHLDELATRSLMEWYAEDYKFIELCRDKAVQVNPRLRARLDAQTGSKLTG